MRYDEFVESVTSEQSKHFDAYLESLRSMHIRGLVNVAMLETAAVGLPAEAGEFSEIVKKITYQGKSLDTASIVHMKKELGDLYFYFTLACVALGTTREEIEATNVAKLEARYPDGFSVERSENRASDDI